MTTNLKIARAYTVLMAASVVGHALSLFKEMLGASYFGVSAKMDAFYAAMTIPNLVNSVLLSPFVIIFVPILVKYRSKDPVQASRIISSVSNFILCGLGAAAVISFFFPGALIALASPGLDARTAADAASMLRILSAAIVFTGAANILTGIINAYEHFLLPAVSGMFITLCTIFFMLFFTERAGVFVLGWGLLAGTALQALFLWPCAKKQGFAYSPVLDFEHPEIRKALNMALIFLLITVISGLNMAANRFMASWLPEGSIAALAYADKLVQVPLVIFSGAIATSIYPFLSAQAAENKLDEIRATVSLSMRMSGFIFIPLAGAMMALARPAIELLFQRGAFDPAATALTASVFMFYSLQLFSTAPVAVMQRLLFAYQDFSAILKIIVVSLTLTLALNFAFIKLMSPPACGIALATSLGGFAAALMYFYAVKRRLGSLHGLAILASFARVTALAAVSSLTVRLAHNHLYAIVPPTVPGTAAALVLASAAGAAVFIGLAAFFRLEEFTKVQHLTMNKLKPLLKWWRPAL